MSRGVPGERVENVERRSQPGTLLGVELGQAGGQPHVLALAQPGQGGLALGGGRHQSDAGLSPSQLSALATIDLRGPLTLGALADHERVAPPTVTKAVAKLEVAGLVQRRLDPTDRRVALVSTTAKGDATLARLRQRKNVWLAARLAELDAEQRARLGAALDVLDALTRDAT